MAVVEATSHTTIVFSIKNDDQTQSFSLDVRRPGQQIRQSLSGQRLVLLSSLEARQVPLLFILSNLYPPSNSFLPWLFLPPECMPTRTGLISELGGTTSRAEKFLILKSHTNVRPSRFCLRLFSFLVAHDNADHPVFGKSLKESLSYASVQISTADASGNLYVWGYIPVVVAKWSVFLSVSASICLKCPTAVCISKKMACPVTSLYIPLSYKLRSHRSTRNFPRQWIQQAHARTSGCFRNTTSGTITASFTPSNKCLTSRSVWQEYRLEEGKLYHPRRRQRLPSIPHPDAST